MLKRNGGYTLIDLLIVIGIIGILVVGIYGIGISVICRGNFWYSDESVLRELKVDYPEVTEILKAKRHVFAKSVITVKEDGVNHDYCLDTNILWNYEFSDCSR